MSSRRLLLADDSATIRKVIDLAFSDEGVEVEAFGDGDSAIERLAAVRPDIVLADVHMPGMNGYRICERIKNTGDTSSIPVLLLVGSFEPFDEAEAVRVGADGYLTKPFQSIKVLVDKVKELVERPNGAGVHGHVGGTTDAARGEDATGRMPVEGDEAVQPDTSDIDILVAESLGETKEIPGEETVSAEYVDAGMDDEMIDATTPSDFAGLGGKGPENFSRDEHAPEPVTDVELAAMETIPLLPDFEVERRSPFESLANQDNGSAVTEQDEELFSGFETFRGDPMRTREDIDLLEIPAEDSSGPLEITTPALTEKADNSSHVVSLSPELIEMIVQKVVERLSER